MGTNFVADITPDGWTPGCAWLSTIHADCDGAVAAMSSHPQGGCDNAHNFVGDELAFEEHNGMYPDHCIMFGFPMPVLSGPTPAAVSVLESNRRALLEMLGYSADASVGSATGSDLLGRVLIALGINPTDEGTPATITTREGQTSAIEFRSDDGFHTPVGGIIAAADAKIIDAGRRPGYFDEKLSELHTLAVWCDEHDTDIIWS